VEIQASYREKRKAASSLPGTISAALDDQRDSEGNQPRSLHNPQMVE
jgi:hypothetical protein